ncbi:low molecular weight phosphatase family protein [Intrasporangium sp. DVR]|uniref:arsenate-mycothiol transferase ArsC n=1 Tax=Intrasporangium sp. DVR TaxID=3127867 RepID=UPI00313A6982
MSLADDGTATLSVVFVCTANIARSPYAERRATQLLAGLPEPRRVVVSSAGMPGYPGRPMDDQMAAQLRMRGLDPDGHVSRSLSAELVEEADLMLTFDFAVRMRIFDAWPQHSAKVLGLHQFADAVGRLPRDTPRRDLVALAHRLSSPDSMTWDVSDPHRRGAKAARRCADEIDAALGRIVPALAGPGSPLPDSAG